MKLRRLVPRTIQAPVPTLLDEQCTILANVQRTNCHNSPWRPPRPTDLVIRETLTNRFYAGSWWIKTMNTPAAKRRRIEATKTLRKPFRSPLISRRGGDKDEAKTGSEKEGEEGQSSADNRTNTTATPSPLRTKVPRRAVDTRTPFKSPSVAVASSSSSFSAASGLEGKNPRPNPDPTPDGTRKAGPSSQVAAGAVVRPSDEQLKRANGDAAGAAADGDNELRHLIVKWKAASRLAAEMVFDIAKQRVDRYVIFQILNFLDDGAYFPPWVPLWYFRRLSFFFSFFSSFFLTAAAVGL